MIVSRWDVTHNIDSQMDTVGYLQRRFRRVVEGRGSDSMILTAVLAGDA